MKTRPYLLHALSPLHAGTGQAADIVDLPIARMKASGIPFVPGSSIKGVLRDARRNSLNESDWFAIFGPDKDNASAHAGAVTVSDARLLALPVRSFQGTFAWVTSPLLLSLARRDFGGHRCVPQFSDRKALVTADSVNVLKDPKGKRRVFLEDIDLDAEVDGSILDDWSALLAPAFGTDWSPLVARRFMVVDDETMTFLWETATQVDARVSIDSTLRTVASGALWLEESLPPETLLVGVLAADRSRRDQVDMNADQVLSAALGTEDILQFGGKATVGRGRCRMVPLGVCAI